MAWRLFTLPSRTPLVLERRHGAKLEPWLSEACGPDEYGSGRNFQALVLVAAWSCWVKVKGMPHEEARAAEFL